MYRIKRIIRAKAAVVAVLLGMAQCDSARCSPVLSSGAVRRGSGKHSVSRRHYKSEHPHQYPVLGLYSVTFEQIFVDGGPFNGATYPHEMKWLRLSKNGIYETGHISAKDMWAEQTDCRGRYIYKPETKTIGSWSGKTIVWLSGWLKGTDAVLDCEKGKRPQIVWDGVPGRIPRFVDYPSSTIATWDKP